MEIKTLLANSLYQLLRPVARIAMRHGLTTRDFHDIAKKAFVDVAREAYGIGGRPTNKSRVATLTGLTRAEVARLVGLGARETGRHSFGSEFDWVVLADPEGNAFCVAGG